MERKLISKKGFILIFLVLLLAVLLWAFNALRPQEKRIAVVTVAGESILQIDLDTAENQEYTLENGMILKIESGSIFVADSDCKDKTCMRTGKLQKVGDTAACVPNKTVVTIKGTAQSDVDMITY